EPAMATRYKNLYGIDCKANEVIVSAGGKQALYDIAIVLFGAGDEVITHAPYWPTLTEQVKLADATPVLVHTYAEEGFKITAQPISNAGPPNTRALSTTPPANPSS